ncbi:nitroreductase [Streptomyces sp. NBC_01341]|uniref:Acg family FMN-binding oxidoreductase n=1 Tax=Streptomyces sp. NBC_01341 TaxID=2903831 RepID=UPI002E0E6236|nr:nitroreductase [Streptomyces sp. NBC_01341]
MSAQRASVESVTAWVSDATMAPSMHNAQPWRFRYMPAVGVLQLRMDRTRSMPRTDSTNRGMHLSCGAALFNLRVAAARAGWSARLTLLPDPEEPALLATVEFTESAEIDKASELYPAIGRRRSSREPFADEPVPDALLGALSGAARSEGANLSVLGEWQVDAVLDLVAEAQQDESVSPEAREELARWTASGAGEADGIPVQAFGPHRYDGRAPVRDFALGRPVPERRSAIFESHPCLAVLATAQDRPQDWLLAGQAMERVLLQAALDGLSTSLNSQALERPELRWLLRDPRSASAAACPQMLLRLGYGPVVPSTPRRAVSDVLDVEG